MTKGTAPYMSATYDWTTNRRVGATYDANGNEYGISGYTEYDLENRMTRYDASASYGYNVSNQRVYEAVWSGGQIVRDRLTFYGLSGERMATYERTVNPSYTDFAPLWVSVYLGGKLIEQNGQRVVQDRLGSTVVHGSERLGYWPYGQEKPGATTNSRDKFATYWRDATGLDYAMNRYYSSGRFLTPDPFDNAADLVEPQTWGRFTYAVDDPVNLVDPDGLTACKDIGVSLYQIPTPLKVSDLVNTKTDLGLLGVTIYVESAGAPTDQGREEMTAIAAVIVNRFNYVNHNINLIRSDGSVQPVPRAWGTANGKLCSIVVNPSQFQVWQGAGGTLTSSAQARLDYALRSSWDSNTCAGLLTALGTASLALPSLGSHAPVLDETTKLAFTGFNSFSDDKVHWYNWEKEIGQFGTNNMFYGVPVPIPVSPRKAASNPREGTTREPRGGSRSR